MARLKSSRHNKDTFLSRKWINLVIARRGDSAAGGFNTETNVGTITWGSCMILPIYRQLNFRNGYVQFPVVRESD